MAFAIDAQKRTDSNNDAIRESGFLPGVVYGSDTKSIPLQLEYSEFIKLYDQAGDSTLIDLKVGDNDSVKVIVQDIQYHAVKNQIIHVDFFQIKMGEEMTASIELVFVGVSQAVKEGGTLVKQTQTLEVRCMPKDLVTSIEVDISALKEFGDVIHISGLDLPPGLAPTADAEAVIATVSAPLTEEEIEAMEQSGPGSVEDVEVDGETDESEDGEEGEEGDSEKEPKQDKKEE